jgi:hypothetical protein
MGWCRYYEGQNTKSDTRSVGFDDFDLLKKPKDLIPSEREERGHGKGVTC